MGSDTLKFTGYDEAIIGLATAWLPAPRIVYSGEKIIEILIQHGMSEDEACEYICFNMEGAYMGDGTPLVVWPYDEEEFAIF